LFTVHTSRAYHVYETAFNTFVEYKFNNMENVNRSS